MTSEVVYQVRYAPTPTVSFDTTIMGTHGVVSAFPRCYKGLVGRWLPHVPGLVVPSARWPHADTVLSSEWVSSGGPGTCLQSTIGSPGVEGPFRVIWKSAGFDFVLLANRCENQEFVNSTDLCFYKNTASGLWPKPTVTSETQPINYHHVCYIFCV